MLMEQFLVVQLFIVVLGEWRINKNVIIRDNCMANR